MFKNPFTPIQKERIILDHLNGYIEHGELVDLIGRSGEGKSTFLDILAGIHKRGIVEGKVLVNNLPVKQYKKSIGYVSQTNYLMVNKTVEEAISFYCTLKTSTTKQQIKEIVEIIMELLGIIVLRDSMIVTEKKRGISGGEKKRVSIGCELVTNPGVIFLDEPTTRLDSFNSLMVIDTLKKK